MKIFPMMQYKKCKICLINEWWRAKKEEKKEISNQFSSKCSHLQMGRNFWAIKKAPLSFSALLLPLRIQLQAYERVNTGVTRSSRMLLLRFLLLSLLTVLLLRAAQCTKIICKDSCCSFVEGFPLRLKALRSSYAVIRDYYVSSFQLLSS